MKTETAETTPEQDIIQCKNCGRVTAIVAGVDGPECSDCGELICARCGCTESAACNDGFGGGCGWAASGVCTECVSDENE